ncbi:uncharacterized protein [Spinacia oleracea]|uniref:Uncharacterized protein isoform X1 n=1 Tax=Spinacia oleracea TaxID=3562 RepID=A0ABM3RC15_SPIOL|nr:uncharacterized protein LOC110791715 isoform X1 [Spinacia oleracea]
MARGTETPTIDMTNPLYLHPSDGSHTIAISKLNGAVDYRTWRRSMEIALGSKRKLGFVNGTVVRSTDDSVKAELWDTSNSTVLGWIHGSVSDTIKTSIIFLNTARETWVHLEKRFSLTNGSRKYKLNRDLYGLKQNGAVVHEYYTAMRALWQELESMNSLPVMTTVAADVTTYLRALDRQQEEQHLFQFLNGLDEDYGALRSQLLLMSPLPTVETACSAIQQEESQRDVLKPVKLELESAAMYSKSSEITCNACGGKGHYTEKCFTVVGYPKWHPRYRQQQKGGASSSKQKESSFQQRWSKGKPRFEPKTAVMAQGQSDTKSETGSISFTAQQFEQLLKSLPGLLIVWLLPMEKEVLVSSLLEDTLS